LFKVFPNPTSGKLKLEGDVLVNANVAIYDINGKQLLIKSSNESILEIDISPYSSGTYILKVEVDSKIYNQVIIKE